MYQRNRNWQFYYHWANAIAIPMLGIAILVASGESASEKFGEVVFASFFVWVTVSGLINPMLRGFVIDGFKLLIGSAFSVTGISGTLAGVAMGVITIVLIVSLALSIGMLVLAVCLWITAVVYIAREYQEA